MRNLLLSFTLAIITIPERVCAQPYITLTLDTSAFVWDYFPGLIGMSGEITLPDTLVVPEHLSQYVRLTMSSTPTGEDEVSVMVGIVGTTANTYSFVVDVSPQYFGAPETLYFGGRIDFLDPEGEDGEFSLETHPDSLIAIELPWIVTNVHQGEGEVFSAYPNPTAGELSLTGLGDTKTISIHDMFGRVVMITPAYQRMDVSGLTPGHYVLRTDSGHIHQFVKE